MDVRETNVEPSRRARGDPASGGAHGRRESHVGLHADPLVQHRLLICDRDAKWSPPVRAWLAEAGIRVVQTPLQAPNANAYAERFVRSIKEECLNRVIPFGDRHLRRLIAEYVAHYHRERNHQGLANELIEGVSTGPEAFGRIRRRQRLGGLLNYYSRAA